MMISACKASKAGGAIFLESAYVTGWPEGGINTMFNYINNLDSEAEKTL